VDSVNLALDLLFRSEADLKNSALRRPAKAVISGQYITASRPAPSLVPRCDMSTQYSSDISYPRSIEIVT